MVIYTKIFSMYYIFISLRDVNILLGTKMIIESRGKNNISGKTLYRNRIHDVMNKRPPCIIRALASARGSVATRRVATGPRARRARGQRARPLEGPKGPRVAKTCESEGPKGPRTSKAKCPSRCLPVLLYVFHNSAQNREIQGPFSSP